jgi:TolA-binding protein
MPIPPPVVVTKTPHRLHVAVEAPIEAPPPDAAIEPPPPPPDAPPPPDPALVAFRTGWSELRDGHNADAIAAFDQALASPIVAEDAAYWAAVAARRSGDRDGAAKRFRAFLVAYPASPHAAAARAELAATR